MILIQIILQTAPELKRIRFAEHSGRCSVSRRRELVETALVGALRFEKWIISVAFVACFPLACHKQLLCLFQGLLNAFLGIFEVLRRVYRIGLAQVVLLDGWLPCIRAFVVLCAALEAEFGVFFG